MGLVLPISGADAGLDRAPRGPDGAVLKDAMARLASGLTLISCWDGASPKGLVATSLVGLSVDPPRLLFSVRHEASAHDALLLADRYSATVLSEADLAEAETFATSAGAGGRFKSGAWRLDDAFAPRFSGGLVSFDLRTEHRIGADSHTIFIAEILDVTTQAGAPLVYFERTFSRLSQAS